MTRSHRTFMSASYGARAIDEGTGMTKRPLILCLLAVAAGVASLGAGGAQAQRSGFSANVDNQWFPLIPGTRYAYQGVKDGKPSRDVMTVTHRTRTIAGAPCVVVHDRLYIQGDRKSTRLNSSHSRASRMPSSA